MKANTLKQGTPEMWTFMKLLLLQFTGILMVKGIITALYLIKVESRVMHLYVINVLCI